MGAPPSEHAGASNAGSPISGAVRPRPHVLEVSRGAPPVGTGRAVAVRHDEEHSGGSGEGAEPHRAGWPPPRARLAEYGTRGGGGTSRPRAHPQGAERAIARNESAG